MVKMSIIPDKKKYAAHRRSRRYAARFSQGDLSENQSFGIALFF